MLTNTNGKKNGEITPCGQIPIPKIIMPKFACQCKCTTPKNTNANKYKLHKLPITKNSIRSTCAYINTTSIENKNKKILWLWAMYEIFWHPII